MVMFLIVFGRDYVMVTYLGTGNEWLITGVCAIIIIYTRLSCIGTLFFVKKDLIENNMRYKLLERL